MIAITTHWLRRAIYDLREKPDGSGRLGTVEHFEERNGGDEDAEGWLDHAKADRERKPTVITDRTRPADFDGTDATC